MADWLGKITKLGSKDGWKSFSYTVRNFIILAGLEDFDDVLAEVAVTLNVVGNDAVEEVSKLRVGKKESSDLLCFSCISFLFLK